ncbi:Oidioi.mRNA.OKI2018_I69.PAR.g12985.t1.cds [Oikopleura dioica]|uniref:Oidioi.mRNA.OKI2018_I69.PAR.g12985.t1.cds n=1 Tax=Oikopleura dioica TaxID=34765 RepID=A0ABN7S9I1_OIKDI|nr:Oidioi.mRNA.OKI2018_I69.PAR.g12985.t1.cds [Oikopleura dioica]
MVHAQTMVPQAFWAALNNQNLDDMSVPQWSIVVNDAGIQCSLFFENPDAKESSKSADSSGICSSSPVRKEDEESKGSTEPFPKDEEKMETSGTEEISTSPKIPGAFPTIPGLNGLPFLQQYLATQMLNSPALNGQQQNARPQPHVRQMNQAPINDEPTPVPGDLMLISQENRRRLINLREEAQANRLSVTAFIRRGALLYFDSDELAMNRLHTLDQRRLGALELETKFYFAESDSIEKSANSEHRVRFRPNNGFNINGVNFNAPGLGKHQDLSAALTMAKMSLPASTTAPTSVPGMPSISAAMPIPQMPELQPATITEAPPSPTQAESATSAPSQPAESVLQNPPVSSMFPGHMNLAASSPTISQNPLFTPHAFSPSPLVKPFGATITTGDESVKPRDSRRRDSKQDQRRRVEQFGRDQRDSDEQYDTRRRRSSPPRKRVEDPAPPMRTRRYSSDLSDEDFNHSRPPPPRRRKNQKDGLQNNDMSNNKVSLQVELANVRDILEKQGMYETQRKDDRRPDRRRREMDSRKDSRDDKGPKRYSNRTRPKHWNERGSQSPPQHELAQTFDEPLAQADEFRDVLGKHFNVSSQRAKELIMQIKSQLTPSMPQGTDMFQQGAPPTSFPERVQQVDNRRNNMTNEQMLAYQQQYQQLLHQNQQQLASGIGQDAMQDMVRNLQQEQYNRQLNLGNFYQQQGSIPNYDASLTQQLQAQTSAGFSGMNVSTVNSAMNPAVSTMGPNALNSLMQHNGTTYFQPVDKRQNY